MGRENDKLNPSIGLFDRDTGQPSSLHRKEVPDGVLVGQAQAGDQCAFEVLVNRYHRLLASLIAGFLKDDEQVYDVLQQVYLQLYLSLPTLLTDVSLKGWLFQVARTRCLDELRRRRRRPETPFSRLSWNAGEEDLPPLEAIPDPDPLPEEVVERVDLSCSLRDAIATLPSRMRPIVQLRCFRQLTFAEIGRTLNLPETTAKTSFYRALPLLRKVLAGERHTVGIS
jgi:RNA polymerase sigma-70 factor (ECF subfamily)